MEISLGDMNKSSDIPKFGSLLGLKTESSQRVM